MLDKLINLKQFTETSHSILEQQAYNITLFNDSLREQIIRQLPKDIIQEQNRNLYTLLDSLHSHNAYYTYVDSKKIENLNINDLQDESKLGYLYCLYTCNPLLVLDNENNTTLNSKVITQNFGYKDDFYLSFIAHKDSLNNEYLQARKALYKTMINLREEREQKHKEEQDRISRLSYEEYKEKQREKERQEQRQVRMNKRNTNNANNLILESNDRNNVIIFLDSANSFSNLIHIHNERIDIFTKDYTRLDIQELAKAYQDYGITLDSLYSSNTQIFLYSQLLLGSKEIESNPLFFGELDKEGMFIESKPIYHLIGEIDYDSKDSKESFTQTLQVFLNGNTLTLLNYSLLDSSLNITLECTSSESQAIVEKEKAQREQQKQESKTKDSQSTSMLHPILEDNEIKCPHNGVVKLKSNKGKSFTSKGIPMVLESDLLNSPIIGCTNNIAGVPTPCTSVSVILPSSRGLKKFNDDYPIMQDLVSSGVLSDKGFPLICTPKENTFRINSPNPTQANNQTKESLLSHIQLTKPILRLHYKIHSHQKDNLPIYRIKCNDSIRESHNDTPLDSLSIDIAKDTKELSDTSNLSSSLQDILSSIYASLKETYAKDYKYHYLSLQLDSNALILILLIPQSIPKVYKELYKDYTYKDYGIGNYHYLYNSCTHIMLDIQDYTQVGLDSNPSNATILTLHTPYKAQRLELQLANGLDSILESKDREQNLDSLLTLKLINGGYKEKYWSFGEEVEEETEEKIDISQGILIASNDDTLAYELAFGERNDTIQIFNKGGIYLFSIERKDRAETRLSVSELYKLQGFQWFESSANNYHKLVDVNPDLQDKEKCEGLGVLYFTWGNIVEFAEALYQPSKRIYELVTNFSKYFGEKSGDWKKSPKGARGFILVSMEGIPYWADAVGQIPFAINAYKTFYEATHNHSAAQNAVVNIGYIFSKGDYGEAFNFRTYLKWNGIDPKLYKENPNPPSDKDSYDNKMILRAIRYAHLSRYSNHETLAMDSQGGNVYEK